MEPQQLDYGRLAEQLASPQVNESLRAVHVERPEVLLQLFWMGNAEVEELTSDIGWLHEDDRPTLEFSAPKALYVGPSMVTNYGGLERFKGEPHTIAVGYEASTQDAAFYQALGALWRYRTEPEKAKDALERSVALDPTAGEAWLDLGELYVQRREPLKAQEALTKAMHLLPQRPESYRWLARIHWQQQQLAEAQRLFQQAASLKAPDGPFAEEIGHCFKEAKQPRWASEYFRSALSQDGGERSVLVYAYAAVLNDLKSWAAAEQVLKFGMAQFPTEAAFPLLLGDVLLAQQRILDAEAVFRQALSLAPRSFEAYYGLGRIALDQGQVKHAVRWLEQGLRFNPYHREALALLHQIRRP